MPNGAPHGILGMLSQARRTTASRLAHHLKTDFCSGVRGVTCMHALGVELGGLTCGGTMRRILGVATCPVAGRASSRLLEPFEFLNAVRSRTYIECVVSPACEAESADSGCETRQRDEHVVTSRESDAAHTSAPSHALYGGWRRVRPSTRCAMEVCVREAVDQQQ